MNQKQHAPGAQGKHAGAFYQVLYKGREFLSKQQRISGLFAAGLRRSMGDVRHRRAAEYPRPAQYDPLYPQMGIDVADVWVHENKMRFKRYYIHGGHGDE